MVQTNRLFKVSTILTGYLIAFLTASAAVYFRILFTQGPDADASAGMYAFGDSMLFLCVFAVVAFFPTLLALYWLRPFPRFWMALSLAASAWAITGPVAAAMILLASAERSAESLWSVAAAFGVLRILAAPLLAPAFMVATFIAPQGRSRWVLLGAAIVESVMGAFAFFHWFTPLLIDAFL
jgi:hypothetical protein